MREKVLTSAGMHQNASLFDEVSGPNIIETGWQHRRIACGS